MLTRRLGCSVVAALVLLCAMAVPALAVRSPKKAMWGPTRVDGVSQFPIYRDLGVGIYQTRLSWAEVAPTRPRDPRNPADPAYRWPGELDFAVSEARRLGMRVSVVLNRTPPWANGGRSPIWAPTNPRAIGNFAAAASRRYRGIRHWMIWSEPSKASRFQPLVKAQGRRLTARQRRGPRLYARMLDGAYSALKRVNRRNLVIGGSTWTGGEVTPLNFIKAMRMPNGRRPRMDLYAHNPFTARTPNLAEDPLRFGYADFSDLDTLARWLDRLGYRNRRGRRLRLFLSEFTIPSDHANYAFNFYVSRGTQARWVKAALKITRRWRRIYTLGWFQLYDQAPNGPGGRPGDEANWGLLDWQGAEKPSYRAFREG